MLPLWTIFLSHFGQYHGLDHWLGHGGNLYPWDIPMTNLIIYFMTNVLQTFPQPLLSLLSKCLKLFHTTNPQDRNSFVQTLKANCGSLNSKSFCRPLIAGSVLPGCTVMLPLVFSALSPAGRSRPACFLATGGQGGCRSTKRES